MMDADDLMHQEVLQPYFTVVAGQVVWSSVTKCLSTKSILQTFIQMRPERLVTTGLIFSTALYLIS